MRVEELDILVGARGISKTIAQLDRVAEKLLDVAEAQALVDNYTIDLDVRDGEVDQALAKVGALGATSAATGAGPSGARASGGTVGDGGAGLAAGLSPERIDRLAREFGEAFDPDSILRSRGVLGDPLDALAGDPAEFFDADAMSRMVSEGILDVDVFEDPFGNLDELRGLGLTSLPERRGPLRRFREFAGGINAQNFHNLFAQLVPMLVTFVGALPAAIAGLVALAGAALGAAAALGGIVGLGGLGIAMSDGGELQLEELTDTISDVVDDFLEAFGPLANQLQPLFERGLDGLGRFFDALAARGDVLTAFADEAIAFGQWLSRGLVNVLTVFTQLADASSDAFGAIAEGISAEGTAEFLADTLAETLPAMARFVGVLKDVMPAVIQLSAGFLTATAVTIKLVQWIGSIAGWFLTLGGAIPLDALGTFIGLLLSSITLAGLFDKALALLSSTFLTNVVGGIQSAVASLHSYIAASIGATSATVALAAAATALLGVLTFGVAPALSALSSEFGLMDGRFTAAAEDLKRFNAQGTTTGGLSTGSGGSGSAYVDVTQTTNIESTGNQREDNRLARKSAYHQQQVTDRNLSR